MEAVFATTGVRKIGYQFANVIFSIPRSTVTLSAALAAIFGPLILAVTQIVAIIHDGAYNPWLQSISTLALGSGGFIQAYGFCIFGVLYIIISFGLYHNLYHLRGLKIATGMGFFIGIGFILVSNFDTAPPGSPLTIPYLIHMVCAVGIAVTFILNCYFYLPSLKSSPGWRFYFRFTLAVGIIETLIGIAPLKSPVHWIEFSLQEYTMMAIALIWIEVLGIKLLKIYYYFLARKMLLAAR